MLVFRQGRRAHPGSALLQTLLPLLRQLQASAPSRSSGPLPEALLRCGELECGLADLHSPLSPPVADTTDALAEMLLGATLPLSRFVDRLQRMQLPRCISVSPPEGFAYYALHPLQYAELAEKVPVSAAGAAVVGIRSIGTTLSAIVAAALRRRGLAADRITVRPEGHPFDRHTIFGAQQRRWIAAHRARRAEFLVVDEGPGLSGSSLLSVGEALLEEGVPRASIAFLCGALPDPARLRARDAARRWQEFRSFAVPPHPGSPPDAVDVGGGLWRRHLFDVACNWPSSWITMERAKFLSNDGTRLFKFEGLGHFGRKVGERARALAQAGFSPAGDDAGSGFISYHKQNGFPASRADLCAALLDRLADYCAFRAAALHEASACSQDLAAMAAWNLHEEFGVPPQPASADLEIKVPVVPDGRMQPHEWLLTGRAILKTDASSHGDDHFYPGPADIAWDLAGAIVEWDMGPDAAQYLLRRYVQLSGDRVQSRLPAWLQAYTAFRLGYCKMAAEALTGTAEEERLLRDYRRYRARAAATLAQPATA